MLPLSLAATLALHPSDPTATVTPWRIVDRDDLHFAIRPAAIVARDEWGTGLTAQVTVRVPW